MSVPQYHHHHSSGNLRLESVGVVDPWLNMCPPRIHHCFPRWLGPRTTAARGAEGPVSSEEAEARSGGAGAERHLGQFRRTAGRASYSATCRIVGGHASGVSRGSRPRRGTYVVAAAPEERVPVSLRSKAAGVGQPT